MKCFRILSRSLSVNSKALSSNVNKTVSSAVKLNSTPIKEGAKSNFIRLSKAIADCDLCSRREAEKWIIDGRVTINGTKITSPSTKIQLTDTVCLDNQTLSGFNHPQRNVNSSPSTNGKDVPSEAINTLPKLWAVYKMRGEVS